MIKALSMEFYKTRHRKVGLTVLTVIIIQLMYGLWHMNYKDAHELSQGWMDCIYRFSSLNCIFMPMLASVIASRLSDVEHKGNTFKLLKSIMKSSDLFAAKFICCGFYMAIETLFQVLVMIFIGKLRGITEPFPFVYFSYYGLFTIIVNLTLILLQLTLSLQFKNQVIGFAVAAGGSFLGLYSLFFKNAGKYVLWSYYLVLSPSKMNWDKVTKTVDFYWERIPLVEFLTLILAAVLLYIIGKKLFIRKEI